MTKLPTFNPHDLQIGDRIKFFATCRWSTKSTWRKINGFWYNGMPTVRYAGCAQFVIHWDEITELQPA